MILNSEASKITFTDFWNILFWLHHLFWFILAGKCSMNWALLFLLHWCNSYFHMTFLILTLLEERILRKICENTGFRWSVFSRIRTKSTILENRKCHPLKVYFLFNNFSEWKDADLKFSVTDIDNLCRSEPWKNSIKKYLICYSKNLFLLSKNLYFPKK